MVFSAISTVKQCLTMESLKIGEMGGNQHKLFDNAGGGT